MFMVPLMLAVCYLFIMRNSYPIKIHTDYNAKKLLLGKLSKSTILKGYEVLKRILDVICQARRSTLEQLSRD